MSSTGPSAIETSELAHLTYKQTLGGARFLRTVRAKHSSGVVVAKVIINPRLQHLASWSDGSWSLSGSALKSLNKQTGGVERAQDVMDGVGDETMNADEISDAIKEVSSGELDERKVARIAIAIRC
ncbi:hypothetical protein TI39_contig464g00002 [Zymoseptoria brevis]|uniref:Uncharacterized protein n=1 Tax=Zymoseptoria brevis TaxID=1047168 RepID=A0A0F4GKZ4_9PEZI|nr:hypothetical protein TI39_contig464g00002 [Zymoseptoria brevis]